MNENFNLSVSKNLIDYCINPSDIEKLNDLNSNELRQILPFLTRIWMRSTIDSDESFEQFKMIILEKLSLFEETNQIKAYLNVDFNQIYEDVIKHLAARKKSQTLSCYSCGEYENASPTSKLLMIANILLYGNIRTEENMNCKYSSIDYSLFDLEMYFQDLSDILCIINAELGEVISLSQFVFTLLHTQSSLCINYIMNLIANSVDSVFQIVDILLEGCNCSQTEIQRHKTLLAITSCWPYLNDYVTNECIRRHCLPSLIIHLARQDNLINILLGIFQFEYDRNWFVQYLRIQNKNVLEKQTVDMMREDLVSLCYKSKQIPDLDLQLFKIYSGLRTFAGIKFNEVEVKALMELILNTDEINVAISFLLIHPPIFDSDANFHRLVQWIKEKFNQSQQSILLVAIYCNSSQLKLLNDFASNLIGYRLQLKGNSLNLSRLFQQVFPDDMLLNEYMRNLPITPKLNAKSFHQNSQIVQTHSSTLGIYFLNQWIKTNSFLNKKQLDLSKWLFDQIMECVEPVHPVILSLINNYVLQLFNLNVISEHRLVPLSPNLILDFFKNNYSNYDSFLTPKILLFYYLLVYETKRRETLLTTLNSLQNPSSSTTVATGITISTTSAKITLDPLLTFRYSSEIYEYIPINYFLLKAKEPDFLIIYPTLLRFVINLFTQLCQVEHSLCEPNVINKNLKWNSIDYVLNKLNDMKKSLVENRLARNEAHMFKELWLKSYSIHGRKLSLKTTASILDMPNLKFDEVYSNPLILLKSNELDIYKCGPLFEIILYILKECLLANKNQMEFYMIENHLLVLSENKANQYNQGKALRDRQDLKNSLVAAQDTAVIQILLDLFLLIKSKSNEFVTREIQCIICSFIHQMFIDNANLAELVHFQGYPTQLIPILVKGVPSMHICLEFVPKLLTHCDLDKQIFAINLAAHLCEKYPIVKTYNVAKLAINVCFTIIQSQTVEERKKFFNKVSQAIVIFYTKLPPLTQECMSLITNAIQTKSIDIENLPELVNFEI